MGSRDVIILNNSWIGPKYANFSYLCCVLAYLRNKQVYFEIISCKTKTIINVWLLIISDNDYVIMTSSG